MQVVCIQPESNNKDLPDLVKWGIYTVIKAYTPTLLDPSLQFVRETFFLLSLPDCPPKRYKSNRFKEIEEVRKAREAEERKKVEEVIARNAFKRSGWSGLFE